MVKSRILFGNVCTTAHRWALFLATCIHFTSLHTCPFKIPIHIYPVTSLHACLLKILSDMFSVHILANLPFKILSHVYPVQNLQEAVLHLNIYFLFDDINLELNVIIVICNRAMTRSSQSH